MKYQIQLKCMYCSKLINHEFEYKKDYDRFKCFKDKDTYICSMCETNPINVFNCKFKEGDVLEHKASLRLAVVQKVKQPVGTDLPQHRGSYLLSFDTHYADEWGIEVVDNIYRFFKNKK